MKYTTEEIKWINDLLAENDRLSSFAATHLADQELLVGRERKRVARECAEIAETKGMNQDCSDACFYVYGKQIAKTIEDAIRDRFGVEE